MRYTFSKLFEEGRRLVGYATDDLGSTDAEGVERLAGIEDLNEGAGANDYMRKVEDPKVWADVGEYDEWSMEERRRTSIPIPTFEPPVASNKIIINDQSFQRDLTEWFIFDGSLSTHGRHNEHFHHFDRGHVREGP